MGISPFTNNFAQSTSLTPFGYGTATINGTGNVQIGPMGVASSSYGPLPINAANTVNRLGVASPFASPFGNLNPITPNSFGAVNPFSPIDSVTPYTGFNPSAYGSFGPNPNPLSPLSFQDGGLGGSMGGAMGGGGAMSPFNTLIGPTSLGSQLAQAIQPNIPSMGPVYGPGAGSPPQFPTGGIPTMINNAAAPNTNSFLDFLASGGGSYLAGLAGGGDGASLIPPQANYYQPQPGYYPPPPPPPPAGYYGQPNYAQGGYGQPGFGQGIGQGIGMIPGGNPSTSFGGGGYPPIGQAQGPQFGPVNPFTQNLASQQFGGTGGKLVSPFGTYITSIGPMGGNANAGFLGAQAAGQASAMVFNPINPGMIVDYANPMYSSYNFNQGFFAA